MRPRVAHVTSTVEGIGGAERLLAAIVAGGDARGWEQVVLNPFVESVSPAYQRLREEGRYLPRPCRHPAQLPGLRRWLRGQLRSFQPDVVHVTLYHALIAVASLGRAPGTKRVLTHAYGTGVLSGYGWTKPHTDRWAGRRFDRVVAISQSGYELLVRDYGYPTEKVLLIQPGWEGTPLPRSPAPRPPTIVCVAKLRPEKGHELLVGALEIVRRQVPDARLVLVGDGEQRDRLAAQVVELGLTGSVEFAGAVPEVWPYLAEADVFALASKSEAFGIAIAEAMAAGLPVVAPAVGGIPELVRPGVSGELFPPGDDRALAGHLVRLLTTPELRDRMGQAGREASENLRIDKSVGRYLDLIEELSGGAAPTTR